MTDTPNGYRALPWYSDGYRVYDADSIEVANTFTPELALGSAKAVAKDIAEAVNAYYGVGHARIDLLSSEVDRLQGLFAKAQTKANEQARRAEAAEARVRELEAENARLERALRDEISKEARQVFGVDDAPDTFTAPDGRVFRVGQRVWHIWDEPGEFGHVTDINGGFPFVQFRDANDQTHPDNLRRVWDGLGEPDVPVGTVLRDSYGCYLERLSGTRWEPRWELRDEKGDLIDNDEWVNLDGEQFRPYVEALPGNDE